MTDHAQENFEELLLNLSQTPNQIENLIRDLSLDSLKAKSSDEFSILESICHLRDIETEGYSVRIRRILNEDHPSLTDIDGTSLAIERDYNNQDHAAALESFGQERKENIDLLSELDDTHLRRSGELQGVGETTLVRLLEMMWEHDEGHLEELQRLRRLTT
jgi:hypothetical protein